MITETAILNAQARERPFKMADGMGMYLEEPPCH